MYKEGWYNFADMLGCRAAVQSTQIYNTFLLGNIRWFRCFHLLIDVVTFVDTRLDPCPTCRYHIRVAPSIQVVHGL